MWKSYKENDGTNLTVFEHAFLSHKSCRRDIRDQPNSFEFVIWFMSIVLLLIWIRTP